MFHSFELASERAPWSGSTVPHAIRVRYRLLSVSH